MLPNQEQITLLVEKLAAGNITTDELNELYALIGDTKNVEALQESLLSQMQQQQFEPQDLAEWKARLSPIPTNITRNTGQPKTFRLRNWMKAAAALFIISTGIAVYYFNAESGSNKITKNHQRPDAPADIQPGSNRAILTLSDGRTVELDVAGPTIRDGELNIQHKDGSLLYERSNLAAINTMSTPKGGQYQLTLSDGTRIWLNAASSVTFPTAFPGNAREITISGEVYLEVAPDRSKPFTVLCGDQRIDVLGTSFNINAYSEEKRMVTTLVDGALRISTTTHKPLILKPREQAVVNENIELNRTVNTDQVLAWKNGSFNFGGQDFAASMRQLERWYNIKVVYDNGIPKEALGGEIDRTLTLGQVLKVLDGIVARFRLEGNTLHVMNSTN